MRPLLMTVLVVILVLPPAIADAEEQLAFFPADSFEGVIEENVVSLDPQISHDGKGSLLITADHAQTVQLFETGDLDVENARIVFQAMLRSRDLKGEAYLEMICEFEGLGSYFSRAVHAPIKGDTDWTVQETPFFLQAGQNPEQIRLNLVLTGPGAVWVDELRLLRLPLQ